MGNISSFCPSKEREPQPAPHRYKPLKQVVLLASSWMNNCKETFKMQPSKKPGSDPFLPPLAQTESQPSAEFTGESFPLTPGNPGAEAMVWEGFLPESYRPHQTGDQKRVYVLCLGRGHLTAACPHFRHCQGTLPWGKEEGGGICAWAQLEWFAISHREL